MATYSSEVIWSLGDQDFLNNRYSRRHILRFDAGIDVPGSSSPHVVPIPYSDTSAIDPEENVCGLAFELSHALVSFHRCETEVFCRAIH